VCHSFIQNAKNQTESALSWLISYISDRKYYSFISPCGAISL